MAESAFLGHNSAVPNMALRVVAPYYIRPRRSLSPAMSPDQEKTHKGYEVGTQGAHNLSKGGNHPNPLPEFTNKYEQRKWMLEHAAGTFRFFARMGYSEGEAGHISVRDPVDPNTFYINPLGVHFAMINAEDMVHVSADGTILPEGNQAPINAAGFAIHLALLQERQDINSACHTHSVYGKAYSSFGKELEMINQDACVFYKNQAVYSDFGGVALEGEEGREIAEAAQGAKAVILQNHGLLTMGKTVDEAAYLFTLMEKSCEVQLLADAANREKVIIPDDVSAYSAFLTNDPETMYASFQPEYKYQIKLDKGEFLWN